MDLTREQVETVIRLVRKERTMLKRLWKSKAAWLAVGGVLTALGMGISGQLPWDEAVKIIFAGLMGLFIRDGVAKGR